MLLHTWDEMDDGSTPWRPRLSGDQQMQGGLEVRLSASLVNRDLPHFFNEGISGFIINPRVLTHNGIRCGWPLDAGTIRMRDGCQAGYMCDPIYPSGYCWYSSDQLGSMLAAQDAGAINLGCNQAECHYNEVIIDDTFWRAHLPAVIEAFFVSVNAAAEGPCNRDPYLFVHDGACHDVREVRRQFIRAYGLASTAVPLMVYDVAGREFRLARE